MLLVAQHVRTHVGADGVNISGYVHGAPHSAILARNPKLALDDTIAGSLAFTLHETSARGSLVLSFLDVAFPDSLPLKQVADFIQRFLLTASTDSDKTEQEGDGVAARFFSQPGCRGPDELRLLKDSMLPIVGEVLAKYRGEPPLPVRPPTPLRIIRRRGANGWNYQLRQEDRERLEALLSRRLPRSFGIADDTFDAFIKLTPFSLAEVVATALCAVTLGQIDAFGGVDVIANGSGETLWRSRDRHDVTT